MKNTKTQKQKETKAVQSKTAPKKKAETAKDAKRKAAVKAASVVAHAAKPKSSDPTWLSILKHLPGPYMASQLAPYLTPFLQSNHPEVSKALSDHAAVGGSIPYATGSSLGSQAGLRNIVPHHGKDGKISSLTVTTMDLLGVSGADGYATGDIITQFLLNPLDPVFAGTKFQEYASIYTKFRIKKMVVMSESVVSAATPGAQSGAFFTDPMFDPESHSASERLKIVGSQAGVDTQAIWQSICTAIPKTPGAPLFIEPDGSDIRLCSAGKFVAIAASDIPAGAFCNYYLLAEVEYSTPTLEDNAVDPSMYYASVQVLSGFGGNTWQPLGDQWPVPPGNKQVELGPGRLALQATASCFDGAGYDIKTCNALFTLPPGKYSCSILATGGTWSEPVQPFVTGESVLYGVEIILLQTGFQGGASNAKAFSQCVIVVPPGIPADVPIVYFYASASTVDVRYVMLARINLPLSGSLSAVPYSATPSGSLTMPNHSVYESSLFLASNQGRDHLRDLITKKQSKRLTELESLIRESNSKTRPAPVTPPVVTAETNDGCTHTCRIQQTII